MTVQPTSTDTIANITLYKSDSNKKREIDDLVVRMIVEDL